MQGVVSDNVFELMDEVRATDGVLCTARALCTVREGLSVSEDVIIKSRAFIANGCIDC